MVVCYEQGGLQALLLPYFAIIVQAKHSDGRLVPAINGEGQAKISTSIRVGTIVCIYSTMPLV